MTDEYPNLDETIQAYVLGNLSDDKKSEFEEYFLAKPEIIDQIDIAQKINSLAYLESSEAEQKGQVNVQRSENGFSLGKVMGWLSVPIPAYAAVVTVALLTPMLASQFTDSDTEKGQIELAAFSSSATRGGSQTRSNEFDVTMDLSMLEGSAAIMIKVTPDIRQSYQLEIYDPSYEQSDPRWRSSPFTVKSGTRDQIVLLPKSIRVPRAKVRLLGKQQDGSFSAVRFCHYSEVCL